MEVEDLSGRELHTFFITSENGIKKQDLYKFEKGVEAVFGKFFIKLYF